MDKPTSIIAALNAGKLPTTQQINVFIDHLEHVGIVKFQQRAAGAKDDSDSVMAEAGVPAHAQVEEATEALSAQGKVFADDLRDMLSADRKLLNDKNGQQLPP